MVDSMDQETYLNFMNQDWPSKRPRIVNNVMPGPHYKQPGMTEVLEPFPIPR
jgi:hypothetical protein